MLLNMKKKKSKLVAEIISLFPEACAPYFNASILGRAQKSKLLQIKLYQLRDFAHDRRRTVDDKPFGGGAVENLNAAGAFLNAYLYEGVHQGFPSWLLQFR